MIYFFAILTRVYFFYVILIQRYISQLSQPPMYFFYVILFYKDISQISQPPPSTPWFVMLTWFAMLGVITWPSLPPGLLECVRAASGIIPIASISKYVIERTMAKCKLINK